MPSYLKAPLPLVTTVTPEIDVIEIVNPWGSRDELVPYSWREDAVTGLADVTTRGRHHPDYHWNYRMGTAADYDRATTGRLWLTGHLHLQDTVSLGRMDVDDVIDTLYAVLRFEIASSGPSAFNLC